MARKKESESGEISILKSRVRELEKELEVLKSSRQILQRAEIAAGTGSWELHLDTGLMYGSDGARILYGLEGEFIEYEIIKKISLPEYRSMLDQALRDLIYEGKPYDVNFKIKNAATGRIIDIHSICKYDRENRVLFGYLQDISSRKREEEIKQRFAKDQSILLKISLDLLETVEKRKALQKIVESAVHLIGLDAGALYVIRDNILILEATTPHLPKDLPDEFRYAKLKDHPHIARSANERIPVRINDLQEESLTDEEKQIVAGRGLRSLLYIPLFALQEVFGVLILGTVDRKYEFSQREMDLCYTLSNITSLAIENSLLFEQLNLNIDELEKTLILKEKTEERLKLLSRAVDQTPVSIVLTDETGNIEYVNPKFTQITGYTRGEVAGKNPNILKSGHHTKEFYDELWKTIKSGKDWVGEMKNKKKNGDFYWESVIISPMTDDTGKITHFVGVKEDITEKKAMLENLIHAKEKAEESDRLKTAFLHNISHEIRTPLNAIVGFSSFLNDPELTAEKRQTYTDIIISSNDQLLYIIDGIMKISHLETGQVHLNKGHFGILKIAGTLFASFQPIAANRNLGFTFDKGNIEENETVLTDDGKLKQILSNLLDNAFKYTNEGQVEFICRKESKSIEFSVKDTGIGIDEEDLEKIFERFYQVNKTGPKIYGGTGLGLSICRGYANLLGGSLIVKSEPGSGSEFTLSIPR